MPSRALPANTSRFVRGSVRNACAVKYDLSRPTSEPIAGRQLPVGAQVVAGRRIQLIVACVADARDGERRQPHLRKQPVDQQLIRFVDLLVEQLGLVEI